MRDFDKLRHNMKSGIEGVFIPISLTKAVKIYDSKRMAQKTRKRQIKAWRKGLAPKVFAGAVTKCKFTWKRKKDANGKLVRNSDGSMLPKSPLCNLTVLLKKKGNSKSLT